MSQKEKTFIEVCSGCGGLSTGFINKNFVPLLLNDNDKWCVETLKANHKDIEIFNGSMVDIELDKYKDVDLFMGGVPCQAFSHSGMRKGFKDDRGQLMLSFIEMVGKLKPKVFLIENVKGLVIHNKGETLQFILSEFDKLNLYTVKYQVLNANDYGVPQKRERLIIVGVRNDIKKEFTFPPKHDYKPVLKDVLTNCPSSKGVLYSKRKEELFQLIPEGGCWVDLPIELQKEYLGKSFTSGGGKRGILKRLDMNKPCLTLLTSCAQKQTERCHPYETRPLQILEYARIQTFPDSYKFCGSTAQIYKQIGNAVPIKLSESLALEISKILD